MKAFQKGRLLAAQNWGYYGIGCAILFAIKYFYSIAGSNELKWILGPTTWWVQILTGISFEWVTDVGYVNDSIRFIIAPSCSGVQFLMIVIATVVFSFVHRMERRKKKIMWMGLSLFLSYVCTIFVNGLRIALSIYLPMYVHWIGDSGGWQTPERIHTMIGVMIYFTSLFFIYRIAEWICSKMSLEHCGSDKMRLWQLREFIPLVFWYFFIVLGLPVLNMAYRKNGQEFLEYTVLVGAVCLLVLAVILLMPVIWKFINKHSKFPQNRC